MIKVGDKVRFPNLSVLWEVLALHENSVWLTRMSELSHKRLYISNVAAAMIHVADSEEILVRILRSDAERWAENTDDFVDRYRRLAESCVESLQP